MHEALFKIQLLLDQFKEGLKVLKVLHLIQSFPDVFAPLFTCTEDTNAEDVVKALNSRGGQEDNVAMRFLQQYIRSLSQAGMLSMPTV